MANISTEKQRIIKLVLKPHNSSIGEVDLLPDLLNANVYVNIFSPTPVVRIVLTDTLDYVKQFSLVGNEELVMIYFDGDIRQQKVFNLRLNYITSPSAKSANDKSRAILFDCVNEFAVKSAGTEFSRAYAGVTGSEIVREVCLNVLQTKKTPLDIENTSFVHELVHSNYMTPLGFIEYLSRIDDTFFYADSRGIHYKSLASMIKDDSEKTIEFISNESELHRPGAVKLYKNTNYFNIIDNLANGFGGVKDEDIECIGYKFRSTAVNNSEVFTKFSGTGRSGQLPKSLDGSYRRIDVDGNAQRISRAVVMSALNNQTIEVEVNGSAERRVGTIVRLNYNGSNNSNDISSMYNGKWLIVAINDILDAETYKQNIMLAKLNFTGKVDGVNVL